MTTLRLHTFSVILAAVILSGCAVFSPVGRFTKQRYTNTVSYFNTFYNAQRLFSDAEEEVLNAKREFLERAVPNKTFVIPSSARTKFQTSIEKNSKVLSFYADSKWVDDALLMIGKAYYYMDDDVRSERKFLELAAQFPNSALVPESQLWLGKSYLRQKKTELGIKQLEDVFAKTVQSDGQIAGQAAYELAQHYYGLKEYNLAEKNYVLAADLVNDGEVLTQIYFQLGRSYTELQQHDKAMTAYERAASASPVYTWIFQAELQLVKTKAFRKEYTDAMDALQDMLSDSKNTEFFGIIHFEMGNVLTLQSRFDEAEQKYRYVDTVYGKSEEAARAYYILAKYYEQRVLNYDSARVLYNKAKVEFPAADITADAALKADMFNKYSGLWKDLQRYDSLYYSELNRTDDTDTVAVPADPALRKDTAVVKEDPKVKKMAKGGKQDVKKDSVAVVDSARIKARLLKERARAVMLDSLQRSVARTKFELGGLFYLEIQQADSAVRWFDDVITNHPRSPFAPRAMYTKAEIYRTLQDRPKNDLEGIYRSIIDQYGDSPYANEARKGLGLPVVEAEKDTAMELFEEAEMSAEKKDPAGAVAAFKRISSQFSASPLAAKALYTAGWHYEHSLHNSDSAVAVYRRVIDRFPASPFAAKARPKVAEYENEMKRIETEKQQAAEERKEKERLEKEAKDAKRTQSEPAPSDSLSTPKNKL